MAKYSWTLDNLNVLKVVLIQITYALCESFEKIGFVHHDLHLDNILLRLTKKEEIYYKIIDEKVKTSGIYAIIMDFGRTKVSSSFDEFKTSLLKMFSLLRDIGINTTFILDPLPIVNYIKYTESLDLDTLVEKINNIKIDYVKQ